MKPIVEFWRRCPVTKPPFVHPDDRAALFNSKSTPNVPTYRTFQRYVKSARFGDFADRRLHFSLIRYRIQVAWRVLIFSSCS